MTCAGCAQQFTGGRSEHAFEEMLRRHIATLGAKDSAMEAGLLQGLQALKQGASPEAFTKAYTCAAPQAGSACHWRLWAACGCNKTLLQSISSNIPAPLYAEILATSRSSACRRCVGVQLSCSSESMLIFCYAKSSRLSARTAQGLLLLS